MIADGMSLGASGAIAAALFVLGFLALGVVDWYYRRKP